MQATVKVSKVGQISIPYEIREVMGIGEGDMIVIDVLSIAKKAVSSSEEGNFEALSTA